MQWDVPSEGIGYKRAYGFVYDGLNRLTDANYCGFNGSVVAGTSDRYNEHFGFDKMGNITNFARNGLQANNSTMIYGKVDDLVLEHTGNQLMKVTDTGGNGVFYGNEEFVRNTTNSGNSCAYDANGNRLYDSNSNVWGIKYNILNLPDALQFYQGHQTNYTYSAAGAKLKVIDKTAPAGAELPVTSLNTVLTNPSVAMTTTTDYVGNMIYENGVLKRILTSVGYWEAGTYYYFLKDHLGSNRVVMTGSGAIAETSSYYPSGMRFGESAVNGGSVQPYRHTGHEMQEMHGLNWIDNLARFRTVSDGGGLPTVDPLAEIDYSESPYAYCKGNPVIFIDPTGMTAELPPTTNSTFIDPNGTIIEHRDDGDPIVYKVENKSEWIANGKKKDGLERVGYEDPWVNYNNEIGHMYKYFIKHDNWIDDLAMHMRNEGAEEQEAKFMKIFKPIVMGLALLNPLIGVQSDIKTIVKGEDIYGNKATSIDKGMSYASILTLGASKYLKIMSIGEKATKILDKMSQGFTIYSTANTTKTEFQKQKK